MQYNDDNNLRILFPYHPCASSLRIILAHYPCASSLRIILAHYPCASSLRLLHLPFYLDLFHCFFLHCFTVMLLATLSAIFLATTDAHRRMSMWLRNDTFWRNWNIPTFSYLQLHRHTHLLMACRLDNVLVTLVFLTLRDGGVLASYRSKPWDCWMEFWRSQPEREINPYSNRYNRVSLEMWAPPPAFPSSFPHSLLSVPLSLSPLCAPLVLSLDFSHSHTGHAHIPVVAYQPPI